MLDLLAPFSKTPGFRGVALFDAQVRCIEHTLPPPYDPVLCAEIVNRFETLAAMSSSIDDGPPEWLVVQTDAAFVGLRRLDQATLVVLAEPDVNPSMLHVACNSLALKLVKAMAAGPAAGAPQPPAIPPPQSAAPSLSGAPGFPGSPPGVARPAVVEASMTGMVSFPAASGSNPPEVPADAVGAPMINHILRVYMRFLGDQAKYLMRDELVKLGVRPQTLRRGQVTDLLDRLSEYIPNRAERRRFRTEALGD